MAITPSPVGRPDTFSAFLDAPDDDDVSRYDIALSTLPPVFSSASRAKERGTGRSFRRAAMDATLTLDEARMGGVEENRRVER